MIEKGRIIKGIGGFYYVSTPSGIAQCNARGKFRLKKLTPMVGDEVKIELHENGNGYLLEILPRRNWFVRPPVSNIEIMLIIASAAPPVTDRFLVDRMCAVAVNKGIEPVVVINKCDLDMGEALFETYRMSGVRCIQASAVTGYGKDELLEMMKGHIVALSGNSGVGKSSLLNMLAPGIRAEVGTINEKLGRGRHTTRHVELFMLSNGAVIADTPGFSSFDTEEADIILKEDIQYAFPEFEQYIGKCRFVGCSHIKDKGCAVREAVETGHIARSRYESYVQMYEKAKEIKEWELE